MRILSLFILSTILPVFLWGKNNYNHMETNTGQLPQSGRGSSHVASLGITVDQMVFEFMEQNNIPGMALSIVQAPYIPRIVGYGLSDVGQNRLASGKTIWAIGPISQGYTAVAVIQLYETGKLNIKEKISVYLTDIPKTWSNITVLQLLQHSSGIADYSKQKNYNAELSYAADALIKMVGDIPLAFTPGTDVALSATNFLILAGIIEKVSGMTYHDFITENQIDFLGLKNTYFIEDFHSIVKEDVAKNNNEHFLFKSDKSYINATENAIGYIEKEGVLKPISIKASSSLKGFSDIWASAEDVSLWDIALAGSVLIHKPENRAIIYGHATLDNGKSIPAMAGWQFPHHKGLMDIKGGVPGFSDYLSRFTDSKELLCVTLLANKEGVDLTHLARKIAGAFNENLAPAANSNELYSIESTFSVSETVSRIENLLKNMDIPVFAKFDHAQNAKEVNMNLRPTTVIVFGSPKVGTNLMLENQSIGIELPLKIEVWEDKNGSVWCAFVQMDQLAKRYGIENNLIIEKMQFLLEKIVIESCHVY